MKKIGKNLPKCLFKYQNKTILDYIMEHLIKLGIKNINVAVGFRSSKIINELKKYKDFKFTFYQVKNYKKVGSAYSWYLFKKIWEKKKRPLIIMHADIFFDYKLIENVKNSNNKNIISCVLKESNKIKVNGWTIKADSHNLIKELKKKAVENPNLQEKLRV